MRREDLFRAGEYSSLPDAVMARTGLPATAKLVYQAMAGHLRDGDVWVWPSIARLAALTGSSRSAVKSAVAALEAAGLIDAARRSGARTQYRFHAPAGDETGSESNPVEDATGSESNPVEGETGSESNPVADQTGPESNRDRAEMCPGTGSESDPEVLKQTLQETPLPPTPQAGGEGESDSQRPKKRKRKRRASLGQGDAEVIRHVWRETTGGDCDPADAASLVKAFTLAAVVGAIPAAFDRWGKQGQPNGRPFTWGWIKTQILQPRIVEEFRRAPPEEQRKYFRGTLEQRAQRWWKDRKRKAKS